MASSSSRSDVRPVGFAAAVLEATGRIPKGRVATYAAIAAAIGRPKAARAVGNSLNGNRRPVVIPCHRVVRSDGGVGGYASGTAKKIALLRSEGVAVTGGKIDLRRFGIEGPSFRPKRRNLQISRAASVRVRRD